MKRYLLEIGTASRNDEALNSREGKVTGGGSQKRLSGCSLLLNDAEQTLLLTLITNDGRDQADRAVFGVLSEDVVHILKCAENQISDCGCESDGRLVVGNREVVFARLHWVGAVGLEDGIRAKSMKLLHAEDDIEILEDFVTSLTKLVTFHVVGDVLDKLVEESDLDDLIDCDELETSNAIFAET